MQTTEDQQSMPDYYFFKSHILRPGRFKILCCFTICIRNHCVNENIRDILFNYEMYAVCTVDQQALQKTVQPQISWYYSGMWSIKILIQNVAINHVQVV